MQSNGERHTSAENKGEESCFIKRMFRGAVVKSTLEESGSSKWLFIG